jgi:hypothetical protein
MQTPQWVQPDGGGGHAIGWGWGKVAGRYAVGHSGGLPGLSTDLRLVPELEVAAAALTNGGGVASDVNSEVIEILAPAFARARKRREPKTPKRGAEAPPEWSAYLGRYESVVSNQEIEVHLIDGRLLVRGVGTPLADVVKLEPKGEHVFTMHGGASEGDVVRFEVDEAGKVTRMTMATYPFRPKA